MIISDALRLVQSLVALGIFALASTLGSLALAHRRQFMKGDLERRAVELIAGVALVTPVLVAAAAFGVFRPLLFGALGWVITGCHIGFASRPRRSVARPARADRFEVFVAIVAGLFTLAAAHGRDDTLGTGRDQQVYAEFGMQLANTGSFKLRYHDLDEADETLLTTGSTAEACDASLFERSSRQRLSTTTFVVPGATNACDGVRHPLTLLHPWGWPAWLGVAYAVGGTEGVYRANSVVFAVGGLLLFALLRRYVSGSIAAAAACIFLALPSSLWIAGVSLSEPLTMIFFLAAALVAGAHPARSAPVLASLGAAATIVHVDGVFILAGIIAAAAIGSLYHRGKTSRASLLHLIVWAWAGLASAAVFYVLLFSSYTDAVLLYLALVLLACAGLTLFMTVPATLAENVATVLATRTTRVALVSLLVGIAAWAAIVRPQGHAFVVLPDGMALAGNRDFREESMRSLATYVSWPLLLAAIAGCALSIAAETWYRRCFARALLLILAVTPAVVYLHAPHVSPDYPWAFRRFVPFVVPSTIIFAAIAADRAARHWGIAGAWLAAAGVLLTEISLLSRHAGQLLLFRENDGYVAQLKSVAAELPDTLVVAAAVRPDVAAALTLGLGKSVVSLGLPIETGGKPVITRWLEAKNQLGHGAWILHPGTFPRTGAKFTTTNNFWLTRTFVAPTFHPPASRLQTETVHLLLSHLDGFDDNFGDRMFGGETVWGAPESGFFASEIATFGTFRYTNGDAWIEIPSSAVAHSTALKIDVFTYAKTDVRRHTTVRLGSEVLWEGQLGPGVSTMYVPLPPAVYAGQVRIAIESDPADQVDIDPSDPRKHLSVGLIGIRALKANEPMLPPATMDGFRSHLALVDVPPGPLTVNAAEPSSSVLVDVRNAGQAYWPTYREQSTGVGIVQLAVRWYSVDFPGRMVADNRWPMEIGLMPGDGTVLRLPLKPVTAAGDHLPSGRYDVRIGMVREGISLFADRGDTMLSLPVQVVR